MLVFWLENMEDTLYLPKTRSNSAKSLLVLVKTRWTTKLESLQLYVETQRNLASSILLTKVKVKDSAMHRAINELLAQINMVKIGWRG